MEKFIHIHAKCKAFETFEVLPEKKTIKRLVDIREGFGKAKKRFIGDKLIVKTIVINPELPFVN